MLDFVGELITRHTGERSQDVTNNLFIHSIGCLRRIWYV